MKIVVATDLSKASVSSLQYAYQLCEKNNHELIIFNSFAFAHVAQLFTKEEYKTLYKREYDKNYKKLSDFAANAFAGLDISKIKITFLLSDGLWVVDDIITNAKKQKADLIIMGTHGAGGIQKFVLGTNTASLIKKSTIPVMSIPTGKKINFNPNFILGCNEGKLPTQWKQIKKLATQLGLNVQCVHFAYSPSFISDTKKTKKTKVEEIKAKIDYTLVENVEEYAIKEKLGGVIMLTNQHRSWFERLFLSSKTADLSYRNRLPVLSIPYKLKK